MLGPPIETTHKHTWRFTFEKSPPVAPRGTSWQSLNRKRNNLTFGEDMLMGNVRLQDLTSHTIQSIHVYSVFKYMTWHILTHLWVFMIHCYRQIYMDAAGICKCNWHADLFLHRSSRMLAQDITWHHINPGFDTPTKNIQPSCHHVMWKKCWKRKTEYSLMNQQTKIMWILFGVVPQHACMSLHRKKPSS